MRKMSIKGVLNLFFSMSLISTALTAGACAPDMAPLILVVPTGEEML